MAKKPGITTTVTPPQSGGSGIRLEDFVAYLPTHNFIYMPCREPWVPRSINAVLPKMPVLDARGRPKLDKKGNPIFISASTWLSQNRRVVQLAWVPGEPMEIKDRMVVDGGWIARKDVTCFNLYRPSRAELGDANAAGLWIDHVHKLFVPVEAEHIIKWLAHRVQHPGIKINHALVLGGAPGVGKDSLLEPVKYAIGEWNFHEVSPGHLLGDFNNFAKSVILRINEARDLGDMNRFSFYDKTKILCAAPPDVLRVNEKHIREYYVFNVMGCIITTNYKTDGIHLPADDRRHFVAWTLRGEADFEPGYWKKLWGWYENGGLRHVTAYLTTLDLSGFDAKAPPPKTQAFWDIVLANAPPEDGELADALEVLKNPEIVTRTEIAGAAKGEFAEWMLDRRNRRAFPHRMERCGYTPARNPKRNDGLWTVHGIRQVIYAKQELTKEQREAAAQLMESGSGSGSGRQ
jgi:hypothetical protein